MKYVCKKINIFFDLPSRNFFLNFFVNWKELSFFFAFSFIFFTYIKKIELEQSTFLAKLLNYKTFNAIWRLWTHCCIWWRTMDLKKYKDKKKKRIQSWSSELNSFWLREHSHMTSDVFGWFFIYLPTLIRYFSFTTQDYLCSKIRCSFTYLPKDLTSYVNAPSVKNITEIMISYNKALR